MGRPCRCCGLTSSGLDMCCCSPWRVDYNADEAEVNWRRGELNPEYCGAHWRLSDWEPVDLDGGDLGGYVTISKSWRCGGCNITENYDTGKSTRVNPGQNAIYEWDYGHSFSAVKIFKLSAPAYVKAELMGDVEKGLPNRDVHQLTIMKMNGAQIAEDLIENIFTPMGRSCCDSAACGEDVFDRDYGNPNASGVDPRAFNVPPIGREKPYCTPGSVIDYDGYNVNIARAGAWTERSPYVTREIGDVPLLYRDPSDPTSPLYMPESACRQQSTNQSFLGAGLDPVNSGPASEIQWAVPMGGNWPTCVDPAIGVTSELAQCSDTCSPDPAFIPTVSHQGIMGQTWPYYIDTGNIRPCWRTVFSNQAGSNAYIDDINEVLFPAQYGAADIGHLRSPMVSTGIHLSLRSDRCGVACDKTTKSVTLDQVPFNYNSDGTTKYSTEQVKKLIEAGILTDEGKYPILLGAGCYMIAYHFDTPTYEPTSYIDPEAYNKVNDAKAALACAELPVKEAQQLLDEANQLPLVVIMNIEKIEEAERNLNDVIENSAEVIAAAEAALEEAERILREEVEVPFPDGGNGSPITGAFNVQFRGVNSYTDNACENLDSYESSIVATRKATMFPGNYGKILWKTAPQVVGLPPADLGAVNPNTYTAMLSPAKQEVWRCLSEYSNSQTPSASPYFWEQTFNCPEPTGRITIPPYKHIHFEGSWDEVESWHCDKRPEVEKEPIWASGVTLTPYGNGSRGSPMLGPYAACYNFCSTEWPVPDRFYYHTPTVGHTLTPPCVNGEDELIPDVNGTPILKNTCVGYCVDSFVPRAQGNSCSNRVHSSYAEPNQMYCASSVGRPDGGPAPYAQNPSASYYVPVLPGSIPFSPLCWKRFSWQGTRGTCDSDVVPPPEFRRDPLTGGTIDIETGEYVDPMDPRLNPDHCEEGDPEFFD